MKTKVNLTQMRAVSRPLNKDEGILLCGNPKRHKHLDEFLDKTRKARDRYYELTESYNTREVTFDEVFADMSALIDKDKYFLDPYLEIAQMTYEIGEFNNYQSTLWQAYLLAVTLIADKTGRYPKHLPWSWHENRHIIRALSDFALMQWEVGEARLALEIYRKLLASNLNDNIGARFAILALNLGLGPDYEAEFLPDASPAYGLDSKKMDVWFDANAPKFSSEFVDFLENTKQYE